LKKYGLVPEALDASPAPVLVTVFDEGTLLKSIALAAELRAQGLNVACYPEPVKLSKQFKFADRIGARIAIVLGPDEIISGTIAVKNLLDGSQEAVPRNEAVNFINRLIEPRSGR
jgi:histidyl-tRNA synthetase